MNADSTKIVADWEGDVELVVGEDDTRYPIQVSSKVLSSASKVFEAMFSHSFKEGNELAKW